MTLKETSWAVTELAFPLPTGEALQLTCAPNYPNKPVYSLEIRKDKTIVYQVDSDSLYDVRELLKGFSEGIKEFEKYLQDATLFDDAITAARTAKEQVSKERSRISVYPGISNLAVKKINSGSSPINSLLGATEAEAK